MTTYEVRLHVPVNSQADLRELLQHLLAWSNNTVRVVDIRPHAPR